MGLVVAWHPVFGGERRRLATTVALVAGAEDLLEQHCLEVTPGRPERDIVVAIVGFPRVGAAVVQFASMPPAYAVRRQSAVVSVRIRTGSMSSSFSVSAAVRV